MTQNKKHVSLPWQFATVFILVIGLVGCAGERLHREGKDLLKQGKVQEGLSNLSKAVEADPGNVSYRQDLHTAKSSYVTQWLLAAQQARSANQNEQAEELYKRVLSIDVANAQARDGLDALARIKKHAAVVASSKSNFLEGDSEKGLSLLRIVLSENPDDAAAKNLKKEIEEAQLKAQTEQPTLRSSMTHPINLEFRDANVRMILDALSRDSGINFVVDKDVRPDLRTTIYLRNAYVEDAVDLVLQTSQLDKKILNSKTVLVYPNTPEKQKEYQDLVVKAFYLQSADVKQVQNTLKTLLKTKDIVIDEKLNLLVMRDSPQSVRLAEKLVALHDIAEPEVMLEVEVLEVKRDDLLKLGVQWPNQLALTPLASGSALTLDDLKRVNSTRLSASIGNTTINAKQTNGVTNLLANPRIRVRNHEKAKIMIGDKVPVVTTTSTATGLVSDNVQYLDVGLKLDVQPDVHLQDEVSIKIALEVSSITGQSTTNSGTVLYQIGTRNADTTLRLRDGETQILGGLINDSDAKSASGVPGLTSLPILGRLFSSQQDERNKTEIVLSITPHLIRTVNRPGAYMSEFWSGTETNLRTKPLGLPPVAGEPNGSVRPTDTAVSRSTQGTSVGPAKSIQLSWQVPAEVKSGDIFSAVLRMAADGQVRSMPMQGAYDPSALQLLEVQEGGFFKRDGGKTNFSQTVDASAGKFFVSVNRADVTGTSGEGELLTLKFRALAARPKTELQLLNVSPVINGDSKPQTTLPPPAAMAILP